MLLSKRKLKGKNKYKYAHKSKSKLIDLASETLERTKRGEKIAELCDTAETRQNKNINRKGKRKVREMEKRRHKRRELM